MWPEVERAKSEARRELVLGGPEITQRINSDGLDPQIFKLTTLNYLDIHETPLEAVPEQISSLTNLQSLVLHSNKLERLHDNVTKLDKLKLLDVSRNQLKEAPQGLNELANIVTLNFSHNLLENFVTLSKAAKLAVVDLANNKLGTFPDLCYEELVNLAEIKLSDNAIEAIPPEISRLGALKVLELGNNKVKSVPGELADCHKLKTIDLKSNPISDRRLLKLIDQCRTKQIVDYVKAHSPKTTTRAPASGAALKKNKAQKSESSEDEATYKHTIKVHYAKETPKIVLCESVKTVREFIVACLIEGVTFDDDKFKKFIQVQNKLHETVCAKRDSATLATHDFSKLPPGDLRYTTQPPSQLLIRPLNRAAPMTGSELFARLQAEANNLRKEKKRNTYSGIHKYLYLIEGHARYPCLLNSEDAVISFPPITNSDISKISADTKTILAEATSSVSIHLAKAAMEALIRELAGILEGDLDITQIKAVDKDGNLKVVYPAKTDLAFQGSEIRVLRD